MASIRVDVETLSRDLEEFRVLKGIILESFENYSSLAKLFEVESLYSDKLRVKRLIKSIESSIVTSEIFEDIDSIYNAIEVRDKVFEYFIADFKRAIMGVKYEYDKNGYIRETTDTRRIKTLYNDLSRARIEEYTKPLEKLTYITFKKYLSIVIESQKETQRMIDEVDLSDILDNQTKYVDNPVYQTIVDSLFTEITIMDLLDIEDKVYAMWDKGCSKEIYVLSKAGLEELHKRELLPDDEL